MNKKILTIVLGILLSLSAGKVVLANETAVPLSAITEKMTAEDRNQLEDDLKQEGISIDDAKDIGFSASGDTLTVHVNDQSPLSPQHVVYLGARVGMMFPFGIQG